MNYITESEADSIMKALLGIADFRVFSKLPPSKDGKKRRKETSDGYLRIDSEWNGHGYNITQSDELEDNYTIRMYVPGYVNVRLVYKSGKETDLEIDHKLLLNQVIFEIDLSDPLDSIVLTLTRDLAPPKTINISYTLADAERIKKERDAENRAKIREEMLKKMKVDAKAGNQLINVYFEPASDDVNKVVLKLYLCDEITNKEEHSRLIGEYQSKPGVYFISVDNLAPGTYGYKVVQYLSDGSEPLVSSFRTIKIGNGGPTCLIY